MKVAALWPVVWQSSDAPFRLFVNNGWSVEQPGNFPDGLDPMCPSRDLSYEVRVYTVPNGIVGEDHWGGAPRWWTTAWCTDLDKARELADALGSHRLHTTERPTGGNSGDLRAEVWEHLTTDRSTLPNRVHRADADPGRPKAPQLPFDTWPPGRPHSPAPTPEPTWFPNEKHPPHYELKVWNEDRGWTSLAWLTGGRTPAGIAATLLQVGTGRPLRLRRDLRTTLPRHLAARLDAGRPVPDRPPPGPYAEDSARLKAERRAEEEYLVAALAERSRGALTIDRVAKRLRVGGQEYRDFLHIGTVCIKDSLRTPCTMPTELPRAPNGCGCVKPWTRWKTATRWPTGSPTSPTPTSPPISTPTSTARARAFRRRALQEFLALSTSTDGVRGLANS
ncbi:hypothetical protein [Streptomyces sp. NPDC093060]|uniref:hypothetical protein n=1 Tax=Streptomyces sp. NPDC093060 TaxID=3366019 RepID=UPI003828869A